MNKLIGLISPKIESWDDRYRWNCAIFIISYFIMGAVTGITNDSFISFLNLTVPDVVKGLPIYGAIATVAVAALLLIIPKVGYKKLILLAPVITIASLMVCIYTRDSFSIMMANIFATIGIAFFDCIYPLMFTSYVPKEKRVLMFSRVMYCNLISQTILGFLNGKIVVWEFSQKLGISYNEASELSENAKALDPTQLTQYINSYEFVLWIAIGFVVLTLFSVFLLKEQPDDYQETEEEMKARKAEKKFDFKIFLNKYVLMWVIIMAIFRFGALIVLPYFPIYLNDFLHISRGTVSTIITLQTFGMLLGFTLAPWLEKKFGSIVTIFSTTVLCIPLMLLLANGTMFGPNVAWVVGIIFFLRSGFANASGPIKQSLPLTFVSKNMIPAYSSLMLIANALMGFIVGFYARYVLLTTDEGYAKAYYIASALYFISSLMLFLIFNKKYNRFFRKEENDE